MKKNMFLRVDIRLSSSFKTRNIYVYVFKNNNVII